MSQLQSTVPGAVGAFYNLLTAAGAAQTPETTVLLGDVRQNEPDTYVMLGTTPSGKHLVEGHSLDIAALGSGALYERYELWGFVSCYSADWDVLTRIQTAWMLFDALVMKTFINYWGGTGSIGGQGSPILGASAPTALEEMVPLEACDISAPIEGAGYAGQVEFGFRFLARLTIP